MTLADLPSLPIAERPISWTDTGIPLSRLSWHVLQNTPSDPIGGMIEGVLHVYVDWRLQVLQKRLGLPVTKLPEVEDSY